MSRTIMALALAFWAAPLGLLGLLGFFAWECACSVRRSDYLVFGIPLAMIVITIHVARASRDQGKRPQVLAGGTIAAVVAVFIWLGIALR